MAERGGKAKFCSNDCTVAYFNERRAADSLAKRLKRRCEACGEPVPTDRKGAKFCSERCKKQVHDARWRERAPHYMRQYLYGLSPERYEAMLEEQGHACAVCGTTEWAGKHGVPHVDHDHATGAVRGLLCDSCNAGLGRFRDDPERLRRAANYLDKR